MVPRGLNAVSCSAWLVADLVSGSVRKDRLGADQFDGDTCMVCQSWRCLYRLVQLYGISEGWSLITVYLVCTRSARSIAASISTPVHRHGCYYVLSTSGSR